VSEDGAGAALVALGTRGRLGHEVMAKEQGHRRWEMTGGGHASVRGGAGPTWM
jgi:hypothetical protein